jgi:hypothetical protein
MRVWQHRSLYMGVMIAPVKCTHTKGNRLQECVLVLVEDRMACIPIAPPENVVGKIAGGLAMAAVGMYTVRFGGTTINASQLASRDELDAAVAGSGGFHVGADWTYRTRVPVIGTMLMNGKETITTRARVPEEMLALLTPNRAPASTKVVKITCAIGAALLMAAVIAFLVTGSLESLLALGFWGLLPIATSLFVWVRMRKM